MIGKFINETNHRALTSPKVAYFLEKNIFKKGIQILVRKVITQPTNI